LEAAAHVDIVTGVGIQSKGLLTLDVQPITADTFTIGTQVYNILATPLAAYDVQLGATLAETQRNIVAAVNGTGVDYVNYFGGTQAHPDVVMGDFVADDAILEAKAAGVAGDLIATTETFTAVTNVFDDVTLGTEEAGAATITGVTVDGHLGADGVTADEGVVDRPMMGIAGIAVTIDDATYTDPETGDTGEGNIHTLHYPGTRNDFTNEA
jgi:hypothetical protein